MCVKLKHEIKKATRSAFYTRIVFNSNTHLGRFKLIPSRRASRCRAASLAAVSSRFRRNSADRQWKTKGKKLRRAEDGVRWKGRHEREKSQGRAGLMVGAVNLMCAGSWIKYITCCGEKECPQGQIHKRASIHALCTAAAGPNYINGTSELGLLVLAAKMCPVILAPQHTAAPNQQLQ